MKNKKSKNDVLEITDLLRDRALLEINSEQEKIRYETKDYTISVLENMNVDKANGDLRIPPYQREFVWPEEQRSEFIESIMLGLPVPVMFFAEDPLNENALEIIDGSQRTRTIDHFLRDKLTLCNLKKLRSINGFKFSDLSQSIQRRFRNTSLRIIVLSHQTSESSKYLLFERINKKGSTINLNAMERRIGAYPSEFLDLVIKLAKDSQFRSLCPLAGNKVNRRGHEELVLRFFVYTDRYKVFKHDVGPFIDEYCEEFVINKISTQQLINKERIFYRMLDFVKNNFPEGFARKTNIGNQKGDTPNVRFEALSVGTQLALEINPKLKMSDKWIDSKRFLELTTTHGSNSAPRVIQRIEYVRDKLLGQIK